MAKVTRTQAFSKATIYFDQDVQRWKIEEADKDDTRTYDLVEDILHNWNEVDGVSITIKRDMDYSPARSEEE